MATRTPRAEVVDLDPRDYFAEYEARAKQTFRVGQLVRLHDDVGTKAQQRLVFRVDRVPVPDAKRKADRAYAVTPVTGGAGLLAEASHLRPLSDAEAAKITVQAPAERLTVGSVVVADKGGLRGADPFTRLVVIKENVGSVNVAPLGGSERGSYWSNVAPALLTKVNP